MENSFESLIKNHVDGYRIYPTNKVWPRINNHIHGKQRLAVAGITALLLLTILMFTKQQSFNTNEIVQNKQATINNETSYTPILISEPQKEKNIKATSYSINYNVKLNAKNLKNYTTKNIFPSKKADENLVIAKTVKPINGNIHTFDRLRENENYQEISITENNETNDIALQDNDELVNVAMAKIEKDKINISNTVFNIEPKVEKDDKGNKDIKITTLHKTKVRKQYYITPSISYRTLTDSRNIKTISSSQSLDKSVYHKPDMGIEAGMNWVFVKDEKILIKTGVQLNYNRYNIRATNAPPEVTNITLYGSSSSLQTVSNLRNTSSFYPNWVENSNIQISLPIGFDYIIAGNDAVKLTIGSSLQPSYLLKNKMYLLSTDLKNYTKAPSLIRRINLNANVEALMTITNKKTTLQIGPQIRYQILSSYSGKYPFKEKLFDYGFKVGISRPLY